MNMTTYDNDLSIFGTPEVQNDSIPVHNLTQPRIDQLNSSKKQLRLLSLIVIAMFAGLVVWATFTQTSGIVKAQGSLESRLIGTWDSEYPHKPIPTRPSSQISGKVEKVHSKEGNEVVKGEVMVRLESTPLNHEIELLTDKMQCTEQQIEDLSETEETSRLKFISNQQEIETRKKTEQARLEKEEEARLNLLGITKLKLELARKNLDRDRGLWKKNYAATITLDETKQKHAELQMHVGRLLIPVDRTRLQNFDAELKKCKAEFEHESQKRLLRTNSLKNLLSNQSIRLQQLDSQKKQFEILAPCSGTVVEVGVCVGEWINPGELDLEISQGLIFVCHVGQRTVNLLRRGLSVKLRLSGVDHLLTNPVNGKVLWISREPAEEPGSKDGKAMYAIQIELEGKPIIPGDDFQLRFGTKGTCLIETGQTRSILHQVLSFTHTWFETSDRAKALTVQAN